jgi:YidC/Oxa1 family membrane protein insertase
MDRKSTIVIVVCILLMFLWQGVLVPKYFSEPRPTAPLDSTAPPARDTGTTSDAPALTPPPGLTPSGLVTRPILATNVVAQLLVISNENARYTFTSQGGGLQQIELVRFPETITRKRRQEEATNVATLNAEGQLPVLTVLGNEGLIGDGIFLLAETADGVRAEKALPNGLRLIKEFRPGSNYLVHVALRWENTANIPVALPKHEWVVGTSAPIGPEDDGHAVGILWYDGKKSHETLTSYFDNKTLGCFPGTPRAEYRNGAGNVVWVSAQNQFFAMIAMPKTPAQEVVGRVVTLPRPTEGRFSFADSAPRRGVETSVSYPAAILEPGKTVEQEINFYIGPKEYKTLASIGGTYGNNVDQAMGFGFFGFFSKGLLLIMNWLHTALSIPYGWAIIVLTILLKIVFWPLTAASTRSAQKMAAIGPQLAAIKEKYKDDPAKFSQKQMEFFRENKINPVAGCLPMLVQLPVFFGLFMMLRTAIELRGASFLWAIDLSKTDTLFIIPGISFIPFLSTPEGLPFNVLPLLYISTAIWQTHITPMSPTMDAMQQRLMRWMPLMFLLFLYNFSSGLALYMTVNNLLTILQTWLMKRNPPPALLPPAAPTKVSVLTPTSKKKK